MNYQKKNSVKAGSTGLLKAENLSDHGRAGDVTSFRREAKFVLPAADKDKIKSILETNFKQVSFRGPESIVRSVYFDDHMLNSCRANFDGHGRRTKLRIRWYDSVFPEKMFFYEVKRRIGQMTRKDRLKITIGILPETMEYHDIIRELAGALPAEYAEALMLRADPVVLVGYTRRHYHSKDGPIRLTLDYKISCSSQTCNLKLSEEFPVHMEDLIILEVKTPPGLEYQISELIYPLNLRATRSSKYVRSCQLLGLSTGAEASLLD